MRQARIYRGVMYDTSSIERVLLTVVVRDKNVEKTINAIQEAARTGEIGEDVYKRQVIGLFEVDAVTTRITQTPYEDRRVIDKTFHITFIALDVSLEILRELSE